MVGVNVNCIFSGAGVVSGLYKGICLSVCQISIFNILLTMRPSQGRSMTLCWGQTKSHSAMPEIFLPGPLHSCKELLADESWVRFTLVSVFIFLTPLPYTS